MSHHKATCEEGCGCNCRACSDPVSSLHLHLEIENLKQKLLEKENHIVTMETNFLREADKFPNGEMAALSDELLTWQDKYSRLYEAHKRVQKVNQNLEDKLLRIVDKCETEKNMLTAEVATLTRRLVDEKFNVSKLKEENERYRNDVNLAIQLLQCKPTNFVPQKYDLLPIDLQQKVRSYISSKRRLSICDMAQKQPEMKTIKVPIPTFPPTAMVYSINKPSDEKDCCTISNVNQEKNGKKGTMDIVSAAIMAKVLEEREKERLCMKHCDTCTCTSAAVINDKRNYSDGQRNKETQTNINYKNLITHRNEPNDSSNSCFSDSINSSREDVNNMVVNYGCKTIASGSKKIRSISNNTGSSPMNIRHNRNLVPPGDTNTSVKLSPFLMAENEFLNQTDYFSEFNMMPVLNERTKNSFVCGKGYSKSNKNLNENYNRNCNNELSFTTETSVGDLLMDNVTNKNCNSDFINEEDNSDNLIVFDKWPPLRSSLTKVTVPTTSSSMNVAAGSTSIITVPGGNLNIGQNCSTGNRSGSARHCSVRLQAGTSNILLDNVVDGPYAPVLYKSRQQPSSDPLLVHVPPPSRSLSASSSVSSCCIDHHRNSTEIIDNVNNEFNSISFSSSSSFSSSTSSSTSSSLMASSLQKNSILAQIRTETEI